MRLISLVVTPAMLLIGILYASGAARSTAGRWTVIGLIELFAIAFSCSWGPTIRIYAVGFCTSLVGSPNCQLTAYTCNTRLRFSLLKREPVLPLSVSPVTKARTLWSL